MATPAFLDLPDRTSKPRGRGLTHVLDKGLEIGATQALIDHVGGLLDVVKIGWGIGYVDPHVAQRVAAYRTSGTVVSLGGTLLEVAAAQGRVEQLRDWALSIGVDAVEVSNGLGLFDRKRKAQLIAALGEDFHVAAEVGSKDGSAPVLARLWAEEMTSDLDAGARWVIAEGRESGTVGIYEQNGSVRDSLITFLIDRVPVDKIIFEAPNKAQQCWFVTTVGPEVNLGNIAPDDVLPLETLRLGLRADTASMVAHPCPPRDADPDGAGPAAVAFPVSAAASAP